MSIFILKLRIPPFYFYCQFIGKERLRKFTFGNNGVESTHDVPIKYQSMTCGFNIHLLSTRSKPSFSLGTFWLIPLGCAFDQSLPSVKDEAANGAKHP